MHAIANTLASGLDRPNRRRLAGPGWIVLENVVAPQQCAALTRNRGGFGGGFHRAGIGKSGALPGGQRSTRRPCALAGACQRRTAAARLAGLAGRAEQRPQSHAYLGLQEFEGHAAIYPPGGFYKTHLDQFRGTSERSVTAILYLNPGWQPADGGQLRLYLDEACSEYRDIAPRAGTLVVAPCRTLLPRSTDRTPRTHRHHRLVQAPCAWLK